MHSLILARFVFFSTRVGAVGFSSVGWGVSNNGKVAETKKALEFADLEYSRFAGMKA